MLNEWTRAESGPGYLRPGRGNLACGAGVSDKAKPTAHGISPVQGGRSSIAHELPLLCVAQEELDLIILLFAARLNCPPWACSFPCGGVASVPSSRSAVRASRASATELLNGISRPIRRVRAARAPAERPGAQPPRGCRSETKLDNLNQGALRTMQTSKRFSTAWLVTVTCWDHFPDCELSRNVLRAWPVQLTYR